MLADQGVPGTAEVCDHFAALMEVSPSAGGLLVFYGELDDSGLATAVAANIAGAASLGLAADPNRAKLALRHGLCDFMVNSLDEALRILKNEIRKKQPVAVVLVGDPAQVIAEMQERGVQPDLIACSALHTSAFIERGAEPLPAAAAMPDSFVVTWSVSQGAAMWLPRIDATAIDALESASDPRTRWLRLAPRYLQKRLSSERYVRMNAPELARFVALLRQRMESGDITVPVELKSDGQSLLQPSPADSSAAV